MSNLTQIDEHQQAADALAANVILRAQAAGNAISAEVRREAVTLIRRLVKQGRSPQQTLSEFIREFRTILQRYEPVLARTVTDAQLAAFLEGGRGVAQLLPFRPTGAANDLFKTVFDRQTMAAWQPPEPPDRIATLAGESAPIVEFDIIRAAAADLTTRQLILPWELTNEREQARLQGYSAGQHATLDSYEKVRDLLTEALVDGWSLPTWHERVEDALDGSGIAPNRLENLFRTTLMFQYGRGQKAVVEHPLVRSVAVFAWRSEIRDSRLTHLCNALSHGGIQGTGIYCVDDPVWRKVAPISHRGCRCNSIFLSAERAAAMGIEVAKKWVKDGTRPPENELFVSMPDLSGVPESERRQFETWVSPWAA